MVAADPATLAAILAEQRATRAALERIERALCPTSTGCAPPDTDRPVTRKPATTSAITRDVTRALTGLESWANAVQILPALTTRCSPNHLRKILSRLYVRGQVDRRAAAAPVYWEYRSHI